MKEGSFSFNSVRCRVHGIDGRGIAHSVLIGGVLALVVLSLLIFGLTSPGQKLVKQILGYNVSEYIPTSDFIPYIDPAFNTDEVKTINSINALTCALNTMVVDGAPFNNKTICNTDKIVLEGQSRTTIVPAKNATGTQERSATKSLGTISFGETSVSCNEPALALETVHPQNAHELAKLVVECWQKFERNKFENVYCNYVDASKIRGLTEADFWTELNNYGTIGDDLAGKWGGSFGIGTECTFNLIREQYEWDTNDATGIGCPLNDGAFVICGDNANGNEIFLTRDLNKCIPRGVELLANEVTAEQLVSKTCTVNNFQLPQQIDGDWTDYMRGHGDPSFVVYYEAFPEGEEDAWIIDEQESYFGWAATINVGVALLPAGKLVAGKIAKYVTFGPGMLFAEAGLATLRGFGTTGRAITGNTISKLAKRAGSLFEGFNAYRSVSALARRSRYIVISGATLSEVDGRYVIVDATHFINKFNAADKILASAGKNADSKLFAEISEETLFSARSHKIIAQAALDEKTAQAIVNNPQLRDRLVQELGTGAEKFASTLLFKNTDEMFDALHTIMKNGKTDEEILAALGKIYPESVSLALLEGAKTKQVAEILEAAAQHPQITSEAARFTSKYATSRALTQQGAVHSLAYAAAVLQAAADSQNNKFIPIGINTIGMHRPYEIPITTDMSEFFSPLAPGLKKKFIALEKDTFGKDIISTTYLNQETTRFFLASPCYGNIKIEHQMCQCLQPTTDFVTHDFGAGDQIVQFASVDHSRVDPYEYAVKECVSPVLSDRFTLESIKDGSVLLGKKPIITTQCVVASVELDETKVQNFCYSGAHLLSEAGKSAVFAASIAGSIAITTALCAAPPGLGCILGVAASNGIVDYLGYETTKAINEETKWPIH